MIKKILMVMVMSVLLVACGNRPNIREEINGKTYVFREKVILEEGKQEIAFTLGFEDGKIRGRALNNFISTYEIDGNNINILPMATTLMAGPEELMKGEAEYLEDLKNAFSICIAGDTLVIITHDGKKLNFDEIK